MSPISVPTQMIDKTMDSSNTVNLRIEGYNSVDTFYEGPIFSGPRNITTVSGGTHLCDGTNNGANRKPGNTPTAALDAASKKAKFPFDADYFDQFQDFFITSIGKRSVDGTQDSTQTSTQLWGLFVNYKPSPVGGCQFELKPGDEVLWAFDAFFPDVSTFPAFKLKVPLKVEPSTITAKLGETRTVKVVDGTTKAPVEGALIDGVLTDKNGKATIRKYTGKKGVYKLKATKKNAIRSNTLTVVIT